MIVGLYGTSTQQAEVGGVPSCRETDLAIVKVDSSDPLPCARLGTSAGLRVGEWVLALGSPLHLHNSVTAGIVSCVDRKVHMSIHPLCIYLVGSDHFLCC